MSTVTPGPSSWHWVLFELVNGSTRACEVDFDPLVGVPLPETKPLIYVRRMFRVLEKSDPTLSRTATAWIPMTLLLTKDVEEGMFVYASAITAVYFLSEARKAELNNTWQKLTSSLVLPGEKKLEVPR